MNESRCVHRWLATEKQANVNHNEENERRAVLWHRV